MQTDRLKMFKRDWTKMMEILHYIYLLCNKQYPSEIKMNNQVNNFIP
jgi:hypothetical protein